MNGFVILNKKSGISSFSAISVFKKKFNIEKCGHMGTLDPLAGGVLVVGTGKAVRLFDYLLAKEKMYIAQFKFGEQTDTLDTTGTVTATDNKIIMERDILNILSEFKGNIKQTPPAYSAKSINGVRAYKLARKNIEVSLPEKEVFIKEIKLLSSDGENLFTFEITCGGGTYIRSIARDMGNKLSTYAVMSKLTRTRAGAFKIEDAIAEEDYENIKNIENVLIKCENVIDYKEIRLNNIKKTLLDGIKVNCNAENGNYKVFDGGEFLGIGETANGRLKIKVWLNENN